MPIFNPNRLRALPSPSAREQLESLVYKQQSPASPVHLSASVVMRSGATGAVPIQALKNPMGQDMELLEIKFELSGTDTGQLAEAWGGTIWCDLVMGGIRITNGSVPVWNFGRAENLDGELKTGGTDSTYMGYSWKLPRPLFVPAGAVVTPTFVHTGLVSSAINVRIGYSARTVFTRPKVFYVPYVAKYASKSFNPMSAAGVDVSSELDLVNPNHEPVFLQRFTGRALRLIAATGVAEEMGVVVNSANSSSGWATQYLTMRMTDSYGRPIVRSFTPFRSVFGALTRSWDLENGAQLDPESFYRVELKKAAMSLAAAQQPDICQAFIGMVGWRELGSLG